MKTSEKAFRNLGFKLESDTPVIAWSADPGERWGSSDDERRAAFDDFPNIASPSELLRDYRRLAQPPVPPKYGFRDLAEITDPRLVLELFEVAPTRTHIKEVKAALESNLVAAESYSVIPVEDCIAMSRDIRGLFTILLFAYGLCDAHALKLNTRKGFAFLREREEGASPYGDFIRMAREDDPHVLELDRNFIEQDIDKALGSRGNKPAKKILGSLQRFAEEYITAFMFSVQPCLKDRRLVFASDAGTLGHIYAYWAELACRGKATACANCGKLVADARKGQKYCSKSCKVQASVKGLTKE